MSVVKPGDLIPWGDLTDVKIDTATNKLRDYMQMVAEMEAQKVEAKRRIRVDTHTFDGKYDPMQQLAMRLDLRDGDRMPFDHIHACKVAGGAYVFLVHKGKAIIIQEEEPSLFPSDRTITQLRLLME